MHLGEHEQRAGSFFAAAGRDVFELLAGSTSLTRAEQRLGQQQALGASHRRRGVREHRLPGLPGQWPLTGGRRGVRDASQQRGTGGIRWKVLDEPPGQSAGQRVGPATLGHDQHEAV